MVTHANMCEKAGDAQEHVCEKDCVCHTAAESDVIRSSRGNGEISLAGNIRPTGQGNKALGKPTGEREHERECAQKDQTEKMKNMID